MPAGCYKRSNIIPGAFQKGSVPHNKGVQLPEIKKKVERIKLGLPINCKKHGDHDEWRLHTGNNVMCKLCSTEWQKARRERNPIKYMLIDAKQHAKKKGIEFLIDEKDILNLFQQQSGKCALTGLSLIWELDFLKPSLDKINPLKGYTIDNIQLVIFEVNRMKTNLCMDRFIHLCELVAGMSKKKRKKKGK